VLFIFLSFLEKRRPRSLRFDSDSLAARSSGKLNPYNTLFISLKLTKDTDTFTRIWILRITRAFARIVTYTSTETTRRRFYYSNLSTIRWCIEYRLFLSFFPHLLFYGSLFTLIVKTLRESLCIPFLSTDFHVKSTRKYFPKVSRHARTRS